MDDETKAEESKEKGLDLDTILNSVNLAEELDEEELGEIGTTVYDGYDLDLKSRMEFDTLLDNWTKLAIQIASVKSWPWPNASNVKYPLLATASMQFAARAYPSLVPAHGNIVKAKVVGYDPTGEKAARAHRVSKFMSWQIMDEMEEWEEEHDRLLITLPIVGTMFKKTLFDPELGRNVSVLVMPKELIVNYWAKSLDDVERITEIRYMNKRKIREKVLAGLYYDCDLGDPVLENNLSGNTGTNPSQLNQPEKVDTTTPYMILEQHCYLDLDKDGYAEPYIVTIEKNSRKVLRIVARFTKEDVSFNSDNEILKIKPQQYYTKYGFVPNPDGGFYDIGFGRLLGPINDAVDTLINQLIDGGSLHTLQAGFLAKGLRLRLGETRFTPGEWKHVNATGQDLKNGIMPLPTREPSKVLFELMTFLVQSGKELASVAEIFTGKMPGQNTPATTTQASIEQGMKVFTAVYKRIFRSMQAEFRKLYRLNKVYLDPQVMVSVLDGQVQQSDFQGPEDDIIPAADPAAVSQQEKQAKVEQLGKLLQLGTLNPMAFTQMYMEAYEIPNPEKLIMQPQQKPDPEAERMKAEAQIKQQESQMRVMNEQGKMKIRAAESQQKMQAEAEKSKIKIQQEQILGMLKAKALEQQSGQKIQAEAMGSQQKMMHKEMQHRQQMVQAAQKAAVQKAKPK